ncbi:MAG: hypothetical protein Q9M28_08990 [Mariprofundaceae bacterium]|nr:hypothetical protein [Mariprofundaceae bacterium]
MFLWINGPAGLQLGTEASSIPNTLGSAHFSLGIIAGTCSTNPLLSALVPKPNDGKVSVQSTKLAGMTAHLSLAVTHTFMMNNKIVIQQSLFFLKEGRFQTPVENK